MPEHPPDTHCIHCGKPIASSATKSWALGVCSACLSQESLRLNVTLHNSASGFFKSRVTDDLGRELCVGKATLVFQRECPMLILELPAFDHNVTITREGVDVRLEDTPGTR